MTHSKILAQTLIRLSQSENAEKLIETFFEYLKKKSFLGLLPQIKNHIQRESETLLRKQTLTISSKHTLSKLEIEEIISLVGADDSVDVDLILDSNIIGGFSTSYNGKIYDGSLQNQINQLHGQLTHS